MNALKTAWTRFWLSWHEGQALKLSRRLRERQMRSVESYEEKAGMSGYIPGLRGEK